MLPEMSHVLGRIAALTYQTTTVGDELSTRGGRDNSKVGEGNMAEIGTSAMEVVGC